MERNIIKYVVKTCVKQTNIVKTKVYIMKLGDVYDKNCNM